MVLRDPAKFQGETVSVEGLAVRSCTMKGCWAEMASKKDAPNVRVKMKDHAFFIPLQSAGANARVEGQFQVKTLTQAMVDHMIEEDGAKFDNRNADGTVTEDSFEATRIEPTMGEKQTPANLVQQLEDSDTPALSLLFAFCFIH